MRMIEEVLKELADRGQGTVYEIAEELKEPVETTRSALRRLEKAGRVEKVGFCRDTAHRIWGLKR